MRPIVFVPLILAAATACNRQAPDPRGVGHDETLVTVTASGRAENRPDEARLQLGVQSDAATSAQAGELNRQKMQRVVEALAKLGVKPDDLQTRNLTLQRIDYGPERGRFRASNVIEVRMRDTSRVGDAVTAVTEAGANVMSGPDLTVANRETATRSAYVAAFKSARERADAYADAAGLKVDRVLGIYDGGEYGVPGPQPPPPPPVVRQMSVEQGSAAPFSPGMNTTEVRVRVDFALSAK